MWARTSAVPAASSCSPWDRTTVTTPWYSSSSSSKPLKLCPFSDRGGGAAGTGTVHPEVVVVGVEPPGAQREVPGECGPQCGVAALFVQVPAVASAGDPDRALRAPGDHVVVAALGFGARVETVQTVAAQVLERLHRVADLRFDHEDLGRVPEPRVGTGEHEGVGEPGDRGSAVGLSIAAPVVGQ